MIPTITSHRDILLPRKKYWCPLCCTEKKEPLFFSRRKAAAGSSFLPLFPDAQFTRTPFLPALSPLSLHVADGRPQLEWTLSPSGTVINTKPRRKHEKHLHPRILRRQRIMTDPDHPPLSLPLSLALR